APSSPPLLVLLSPVPHLLLRPPLSRLTLPPPRATYPLSLHDALPIFPRRRHQHAVRDRPCRPRAAGGPGNEARAGRAHAAQGRVLALADRPQAGDRPRARGP